MNAAFAAEAAGGITAAVARYYDTTVDLYEELWGEHVHHGYWDPDERPGTDVAQRHGATDRLVRELVAYAGIPAGACSTSAAASAARRSTWPAPSAARWTGSPSARRKPPAPTRRRARPGSPSGPGSISATVWPPATRTPP